MRWALIESGRVANVVEQDDQPQIEGLWVACGNAGPGWLWDGGEFSDPAPSVAASRHLSVGSFFDRFGPAKWAILADTSASVQAVVRDASVRRYIDLDNPQLPSGLAVIVAAGHAIDADEILTAPVRDEERP